jgi:hypothetical protein
MERGGGGNEKKRKKEKKSGEWCIVGGRWTEKGGCLRLLCPLIVKLWITYFKINSVTAVEFRTFNSF